MKRVLPLCLTLLLLSAAPAVHAAFYQWTDAEGVEHFTDKSSNIPQKYRKKAKKVDLSEEPSAVKVNGPAAASPAEAPSQPVSAAPQPQALLPGGHPEQWWREQYTSLRSQMVSLQDGIAKKQGKLAELRRKRAIYQRSQDRLAVNAAGDDIVADQLKLADLSKQMEDLDAAATRAAVPMEWRR